MRIRVAPVDGESYPALSSSVAVDLGATVFLFGGKENGGRHVNQGWSFHKESRRWVEADFSGETPCPREGHSLTRLDDRHVLLFGGMDDIRQLSDGYILDLSTMTWSSLRMLGEVPCRRTGHAIIPLSPGFLLLFGGFDGTSFLNDGHFLRMEENLESGSWNEAEFRGKIPSPRSSFAFEVLRRGDIPELVIFSGWNSRICQDMCVLNPVTCEWSEIPLVGDVPAGRLDASMVSLGESRFLLWGGSDDSNCVFMEAHIIRITTGKCELLFSEELENPEGEMYERAFRQGHVAFALTRNSIMLWGGQDGDLYLGDGIILDISQELDGESSLSESFEQESESPSQEEFQYVINEEMCLGKGTFGEVFQGVVTAGPLFGTKVAVKVISVGEDRENAKILQREIDLMKELEHPNITRLLHVRTLNRKVHIVMDLCTRSMASLLKMFGGNGMPLEMVRHFTAQMLSGLEYLHSKRIVHRDLKPNNVLLVEDEHGATVVKLADFGCSKQLEMGTAAGTNEVGTMAYCAPEVIRPDQSQRTVYGFKVDVWSLGCTVLELLTGKSPYDDATNVFAVMFRLSFQKSPPDIPEDLDPLAKDFVSQCLL